MARTFITAFLLLLLSCDSFYNYFTLVNESGGTEIRLKLDDNNSYLSITCQLLESRADIRPSQVIFSIQIESRQPNIHFENTDVMIYFHKSDSEILETKNFMTRKGKKSNLKNKFQVIERIEMLKIKGGEKTKIGLKLPPIVLEGRLIDLGIIEFGTY